MNDLNLKAQVHNNLCFHFANLGAAGSAQARNHLDQLLSVLKEWQPSGEWAPNYLDTIGWTRWALRPRPTPDYEYVEILKYFNEALQALRTVEDQLDRDEIEGHRQTVLKDRSQQVREG